jgi:hypothetical protein
LLLFFEAEFHFVAKADLELAILHLPNAEITDMHHHTRLQSSFLTLEKSLIIPLPHKHSEYAVRCWAQCHESHRPTFYMGAILDLVTKMWPKGSRPAATQATIRHIAQAPKYMSMTGVPKAFLSDGGHLTIGKCLPRCPSRKTIARTQKQLYSDGF